MSFVFGGAAAPATSGSLLPNHATTTSLLSESNEPPSPPFKNDVAKSELIDGFANLLNTGKGSDMVITCNGMTFNVHKAILASRSKFFETACWGDFKESQKNCIDLPDDDAGVVKKMIDYLYLLDYGSDKDTGLRIGETEPAAAADRATEDVDVPETEHLMSLHRRFPHLYYDAREGLETLTSCGVKNCNYDEAWHSPFRRNASGQPGRAHRGKNKKGAEARIKRIDHHLPIPELAIHASMYGIADKYGIQGLKSIATQKLKAALQHEAWISDARQGYSSNMMHEFAAAVKAAWGLTPDSDKGVRAPLLDQAWRIRVLLLEAKEFQPVAQQMPQFAWDLFAQAVIRT